MTDAFLLNFANAITSSLGNGSILFSRYRCVEPETRFLSKSLRLSSTKSPIKIIRPYWNFYSKNKSRYPSNAVAHDKEFKSEENVPDFSTTCNLLCLSNGHGEDFIAVAILNEIRKIASNDGINIRIQALPLVGLGNAYINAGIETIGPAKVMPSGGFIYMDGHQIVRDLNAGLLSLTRSQFLALENWVSQNPEGALLAVGDIFPLLLCYLATKRQKKSTKVNQNQHFKGFAFVGTAKSEFYLRDEKGEVLKAARKSLFDYLFFPKCVYYPWERLIMSDQNCKLVAPRDWLTEKVLKENLPNNSKEKVKYLGNPMMDNLQGQGVLDSFMKCHVSALRVTLLPGSRYPETLENWKLILDCARSACNSLGQKRDLIFLAPIVPSLPRGEFFSALSCHGWKKTNIQISDLNEKYFQKNFNKNKMQSENSVATLNKDKIENDISAAGNAGFPSNSSQSDTCQNESNLDENIVVFQNFDLKNGHFCPFLIFLKGYFNDCVHFTDLAVSMSGTATEQIVGLGKPVFSIPGRGPQFNFLFAEAQTRLLGKSVILCSDPAMMGERMEEVMSDPRVLESIAKNGRARMGPCGSAKIISEQVLSFLHYFQ